MPGVEVQRLRETKIVNNKWVVIFLGLMSVVFGTIAVITYNHSQKLLAEGMTTTGTVVRLERSAKGASYPVVRFKTSTGEELVERGKVGSSPPEHREGETVAIIYDKNNPKNWCIHSWLNLYFLPTMFGAAGSALLFASIVVGIFSNRRRIAVPLQKQ